MVRRARAPLGLSPQEVGQRAEGKRTLAGPPLRSPSRAREPTRAVRKPRACPEIAPVPTHAQVRMLLPPPSIGSVAGLSLAFAPAAWRSTVLSGPLSFAYLAAKSAGAASPPLALLTLGHALSSAGSGRKTSRTRAASAAARDTSSFTRYELAVVVLVKLVLLPAAHLLLAPTLHPRHGGGSGGGSCGGGGGGGGGGGALDPLHTVLLLQAAMPAAVSVQAIFHRECADTKPLGPLMLAMYGACMPTIVVAIICASQLA
jgi:predicted permease